MADRNDFLQGVAFIFCVILLVIITLGIIIPAAAYDPTPEHTHCRDAESLKRLDPCPYRGSVDE